MNLAQRGAARVSIVWIITIGVLFVASLAFGFVTQSDMSAAASREDAAVAAQVAAETSETEMAAERSAISKAVGWYDRETAAGSEVSNVEAVGQGLQQLRDTFALADTVTDFEQAIAPVIAAYDARGRELQNAKTQVQNLTGELEAARTNLRNVTRDKDGEIAQVRQEKADDAATQQARIDDLEQRIDQLNDQNSELDLELRNERQARAEDQRAHQKALDAKDVRINELASVLAFTREDRAEAPDGNVLAVSAKLGIGWVDRGSRNRLTNGTRFSVYSGNAAGRVFKAMAEVMKVEADRAQVRFYDQADDFRPVVPGDVIVNPLYDPEGGRNAVLVGRFDSTYSEQELKLLLADIGINVQAKLDKTTHYLIVGSEMWTDEDGEPLEEPMQPSDLPVYKQAEADGVQIVPLQNIREYFTVRRS